MVHRNSNFLHLNSSCVSNEVIDKKNCFLKRNSDHTLINLDIDEPNKGLIDSLAKGVSDKLEALSTENGYTGYPDYRGDFNLRESISKKIYQSKISADEIFISDGLDPDLTRLQYLFSSKCSVAVQNPGYPSYKDLSTIAGKISGEQKSILMKCNPESGFFPNFSEAKDADLLYFCSPNNPTGTAATRKQLEELVGFAKKDKCIIIYDSTYREFIKNPEETPKSIFEIEGAREVAFEMSCFSKVIGYPGVKLGWTVCPKELRFSSGELIWDDWSRIAGTLFNGPGNLEEACGKAAMTDEGLKLIKNLVEYYMENVEIVKPILTEAKMEVYGGTDSPYLWVRVPEKFNKGKGASWAFFEELLDKCSILCTPGVGFGDEGEGFVRFSMFAPRKSVTMAAEKLRKYLSSI